MGLLISSLATYYFEVSTSVEEFCVSVEGVEGCSRQSGVGAWALPVAGSRCGLYYHVCCTFQQWGGRQWCTQVQLSLRVSRLGASGGHVVPPRAW